MKKLFYIAFGLCAIMASCAKEIEQPLAENSGKSEQVTPRNSCIPACITAEYSEPAEEESAQANVAPATKTSYPGGVFNWVLNDEVAVYYVDDATTPTQQGWYAYKATKLGTGNATAEFFIAEGQTDKEEAMESWACAGIAVYPSRAAQPVNGYTNKAIDANYKNKVYVKVPQQVSGDASDIMLIGTTSDPSVSTSFKFRTAMAVLKVTVTGIPAQAKQLRLYTSDKATYPLDGDFLLNKDGEGNYCITKDDYRKWTNGETLDDSANDYIFATISTDVAIASRDFYFNIPVGSYAKGAFSLKLVDANGDPLLEKTLNKVFEFSRNDLVNTPALANEWVTLGTGKFYNKKVTYGTGKPDDDWSKFYHADVVIQQNVANTNQYRVINPYGAYWAANNVTPAYTPDKYLTFTVDLSQDRVTGYDDHHIGQNLDDSSGNVFIKYNDTANNTVWQKADGKPLVVQLAPLFRYNDDSAGWDKSGDNHIIEILFPGYAPTDVAIASDSIPTDTSFHITVSGTNVASAKAGCKETAASAFSNLSSAFAPATGTSFSGYTGNGNFPRYIAVCAYNSDGTEIFHDAFEKNIYTITTAKANEIVGTYTHDYMVGTVNYSSADANGDNTLTLAVSNDIFKGNIMLTEFAGYCYDVSASTHTTLVSDFSQFTDGSPIYGSYNTSYSDAVFFANLDTQLFYKDAGGYSHYITPEDRDYIRVYFNSDGFSSGISHDLVAWEPSICNRYYNSGFGTDLKFSSFVAHNSTTLEKLVPLTKSMLSTNTSYGEDGSGDSGGMAALVDKRYDTHWHSNYKGTTNFGEYGIYIQIDLGTDKKLQNFKLRFRTRDGVGHGLPTKYYVAASNTADFSSGVYKTDVRTITGTASKLFQEIVAADAEYRYIRLCITEMNHVNGGSTAISLVNTTENGQHYTHLAEIQLWEN